MTATCKTNRVLQYLLDREWSMGCHGRENAGQCDDCHGVHPSRMGHPLHPEESDCGHAVWCSLAKAIEEAGGTAVRTTTSKYWPHMLDPHYEPNETRE